MTNVIVVQQKTEIQLYKCIYDEYFAMPILV